MSVVVEALAHKPHSTALVLGEPRENATIKDTAWVEYVLM